MEPLVAGQSFLADLLQTIADRGRFWGTRGRDAVDGIDFGAQCELLLSGRGEASGLALAQDILAAWDAADADTRLGYLEILAARFGPELERLEAAIADWQKDPSGDAATRLHEASEPRRQELVRRLNMAPGATAAILDMRAETLGRMREHAALRAVEADLRHLISSWFNRGFLVLRRIDWTTSASILEKIIRYEAVHAIHSWDDLRRRLAPDDRRCFAFFHPRLPQEPLIFVEVALTRDVPAAIAAVLSEDRAELPAAEATTAVFYSISNTQVGLRGVSFGNFLLKQVIDDLRDELPGLTDFVTLSPVPGFAAWLSEQEEAFEPDAPALLPLVARYLVKARGPGGLPLDPVARFHLGNGAALERINPSGDLSPNALATAHGVMVNYRYRPDELERNHELFATKGEVAATPAIRRMAETAETAAKRRRRAAATLRLPAPAGRDVPE
jgi:malonyl-CoA decarboxylase